MDVTTALKQLYEDRALALNAREEVLSAETVTPADRARDAELKVKVDNATSRIQELEKLQQEKMRELSKTDYLVSEGGPITQRPERGGDKNPRSYASLFPNRPLGAAGMGGFRDIGDFVQSVVRGGDQRLSFNAAAEGATGSLGGFSVPHTISAGIFDDIIAPSEILSRARIIPMETRSVRVWGFDNSTQSSGDVLSGVTMELRQEGEAFTSQTATTRSVTLDSLKLGALADVSNELLADSSSFGMELQSRFAEAVRAKMEWYLINGTGAGQPQGILNAPSLIEQAEEGTQTGATIIWENVINMRSRLHDDSGAVWMINPDALAQLYSITESNGGLKSVLTSTASGMTLLGLPLIVSRNCKTLGTTGDLLLLDLRHFAVGIRADFAISVSTDYAFNKDETSFRFIVRFDSKDLWNTAITPPNSSTTLGWAISLATRS